MAKQKSQAGSAQGAPAPSKTFAEMSPEEQVAYVASLEEDMASLAEEKAAAEEAKATAEAELAKVNTKLEAAVGKDTSFKIGDQAYDFKEKHINVIGIGVVNVERLIDEDPKKFDAVCAKLVEINSGFIHKINE